MKNVLVFIVVVSFSVLSCTATRQIDQVPNQIETKGTGSVQLGKDALSGRVEWTNEKKAAYTVLPSTLNIKSINEAVLELRRAGVVRTYEEAMYAQEFYLRVAKLTTSEDRTTPAKIDSVIASLPHPSNPIDSADEKLSTSRLEYGFTVTGLFYVSAALVKEARGGNPYLRGEMTEWKDIKMTLDKSSGYYYHNINLGGRFYGERDRETYCFNVGGGTYIPQTLKDIRSQNYDPDDLVPNPYGSYNFSTVPVNAAPFIIIK